MHRELGDEEIVLALMLQLHMYTNVPGRGNKAIGRLAAEIVFAICTYNISPT